MLELSQTQNARVNTIQLDRVQFWDAAGKELPYDANAIVANSERCHGNENFRNLGAPSSLFVSNAKWCSELDWFPQNKPAFQFTFAEPVQVATVVLTSANDEPVRDPSEFALYVGSLGDRDA